jgi:hypothetical protein
MDCTWSGIEKVKGLPSIPPKPISYLSTAPVLTNQTGEYNFTEYDTLASNMEKNGLKAILILDYNNPLYDGGLSPHTDEGRAAFAKWAAATVAHFQGRGYLWEV